MSKKLSTLIILIVLATLGGAYYWFFVRMPSLSINTNSGTNGQQGNGIFAPFGAGGNTNAGNGNGSSTASSTASSTYPTALAVPILRELSKVPVGGMSTYSTATSTVVRWIDRGTGHIYQAYGDNTAIDEISNTTVPMIYQSYWNTTASEFIFQSLNEDSDIVTNFYVKLSPTTVNTNTSSTSPVAETTQYTLVGTPLVNNTLEIASLENQVFTLTSDGNGGAAGYIANFDGTKKTQIFDTPLTELNVQWPTAGTIALTTKGSGYSGGFLYFVNPKDGIFNKVIGNVTGLSTLVNTDGSEVLYSQTSNNGIGITTSIYNVSTGRSQDLPFSTMPEKCAWSSIQKTIVYCAIPSTIPSADYPDAWYQGRVSFSDSIWSIDTVTGDVHELIDLLKTSGTAIDAENLKLSPKEDFLYFINKKDVSLWTFDLNAI